MVQCMNIICTHNHYHGPIHLVQTHILNGGVSMTTGIHHHVVNVGVPIVNQTGIHAATLAQAHGLL